MAQDVFPMVHTQTIVELIWPMLQKVSITMMYMYMYSKQYRILNRHATATTSTLITSLIITCNVLCPSSLHTHVHCTCNVLCPSSLHTCTCKVLTCYYDNVIMYMCICNFVCGICGTCEYVVVIYPTYCKQ